jgi:omega-hydroxy-beta-dihydromenaquinone-9 sulfotransferase
VSTVKADVLISRVEAVPSRPLAVAEPKAKSLDTSGIKTPKLTRQGLCCVWHGLGLPQFCALMAKHPRVSLGHYPRLASIAAVATTNSFWNTIEQLLYGRAVERTVVEHPPIFILGHWRSGTTLLHNLFTLDSGITFPNLYQVLFPGHFLVTESWLAPLTAWTIPKNRPMDNVATGWKLAQEDEVALLLTTLLSPYLMMAFQGDREKYGRYFDLRDMTADEQARWKSAFMTLVKKITYLHRKPVVMKSPSHTYRVPVLLEMFPNAKFVYIHRDPYAVYTSSLHLRKAMFIENGLHPPNFEGNEEDTFHVYEKAIEVYEETKHLIPEGQLHEIRFADLEADPLGIMRQTYEALSLGGWNDLEPKIREQLPELQSYKKNKFSMSDEAKRHIYHRLKPVFDQYGYPSQLADEE